MQFPRPTRLLAMLACACLIFWALGYAGRVAAAPLPAQTIPTAAQADTVCAKCHADITSRYLATPHADASGDARAKLIPGVFTQSNTGAVYSISEQDGTAWLRFRGTQQQEMHGAYRLDSFLGSGHLGTTYLFSVDRYLFESPVAYYTHMARYDMKPGLDALHESAPAIPMEPSCLRCHMSGVAAAEPGTLNRYPGAAFQFGGIVCESCHGNTALHVQSGGKTPVVNPAKLSVERRDSVCISCHLEGDVSVEKNHRSMLNFRPGDSISEFVSFFVYGRAEANARGVSEVEQFAVSHCKRASGDAMSCTTCHDPHFVPSAAERVAYYRAKCLQCHSASTQGAAFVATHHPENLDCASCHMPRGAADNIPHVAWTDHRILRQPDSSPGALVPTATAEASMVPVFSPSATSRDMALALYASVMDGHRENGAQAYALLTDAQGHDAHDVQVLNARGTLANMKGDTAQAGEMFAAVLALEPHDRTAATNLAVLEARSGNLAGARTLLQQVFDRNQDLPVIAENLAAIDCMQGDAAAAQHTLQAALRFNPGSHDLQQRLTQTATCTASR